MGNIKGRQPMPRFRGRALSSQRGRGGFGRRIWMRGITPESSPSEPSRPREPMHATGEGNRTRQIRALREQARSVQDRLHDLNRRISTVEHGFTPSDLKAFVDPDKCVACGTCEAICPACAISIEEIARVDRKQCIGCGSCVAQCPRGAIVLNPL